jgi:HAD superfamily hydrolase (TIGR01549 family)
MPGTRAVLLDLWHTLAYLEPSEEERYMAAQLDTMARLFGEWPRSPRGRHPPIRDPHRAAEEVRAEAVAAAARGVTTPFAVQALHGARRLGRMARPIEYTQALASLAEATPLRITPGAVETLATLHERHFRLGLVSNTIGEPGEVWQRKLERAGVGERIEAWAFSDQLPWTKPAPEIFWHCLGMLAVHRERAVHVGDSWSDIAGARAAGLRAGILFTGEQKYGESYAHFFASTHPEPPDAGPRISRLVELPDLAEKLLDA